MKHILGKNESMQDAVRTLEAAFGEVEDIAPAAYWYENLREDGSVKDIHYSGQLRSLLGCSSAEEFPDELSSLADAVHPDDARRVSAGIFAAEPGAADRFAAVCRVRTAGGRYLRVKAAAQTVRDSEGNPVGKFGSLTELSDSEEPAGGTAFTETFRHVIAQHVSEYGAVMIADLRSGLYRTISEQDGIRTDAGPITFQDAVVKNVLSYVHEDDKESFYRNTADFERIRKEYAVGESRNIEYRSRSGRGYVWYRVRLNRISEDELLIAIKNCDEEMRQRIARDVLLEEYDAVYELDLENDEVRVIRSSRISAVGAFVENQQYSSTCLRFAGTVSPQYRQDWIRFSDPEFIRSYMADEDHREYVFELPGVKDQLRRFSIDILERNASGAASVVLLSFMGIDEHRSQSILMNRRMAQTNRIVETLSRDFICVNYVEFNRDRESDVAENCRTSELLRKMIPGWDAAKSFGDRMRLLTEFVLQADRPLYLRELKRENLIRRLQSEDVVFTDIRFLIEGTVRYYQFKFSAVREEGRLIGMVAGLHSIDEQMRKEIEAQAHREQNAQMKQQLEMINGLASGYNALYYINIDANVLHIYALDETKYPGSRAIFEVEEKDFYRIIGGYGLSGQVHPDDRQLFADFGPEWIREKLTDRKKYSMRFRAAADGGYRWDEMELTKYEAAGERANAVAVGFTDRDEEIRAEQAVNSAFEVLGQRYYGEEAIDRILSIVGDYYGAERCYVFEYKKNVGMIDNRYEWVKSGIEPMLDKLQNIPLEVVDGWNREFDRQGAFYMDALDSEHNTEETKEILEMQGIESLVAAPLLNGDEIVGFVGVDNPTKAKHDINILAKASSVVYSEILKRNENGEERLTLDKLTDAFISVYYVDLSTDYMHTWKIDEQYKEAYGAVQHYSVSMGGYADRGVALRERERTMRMTSPAYVLEQFRTVDRFKVETTDVMLGYERAVVLEYIKISEDGSRFVVCASDMSESLAKEKEQKAQLEESLTFTNFFLDTYVSAYYVDFDDLSCQVYKRTSQLEEDYPIVTNYFESLSDYIGHSVHPDDRDDLLRIVRPETMRKLLREKPEYSHIFRVIAEGTERYYRMQVIRGSGESQAAFGFIDVTDEVNEQNNRLKEAEEARKLIDSIAASYNLAFAVNMETDRFKLIRTDDTLVGSRRSFDRFAEAREYFVGLLPESDRANMRVELDYGTIREKLKRTKSYDVEYRIPVEGAILWHVMNVTMIDDEYIAVGFAQRDLEITQKHLEGKRYGEYFALYEIDIDSGMMKIVKDSPYYELDRSGTAMPYSSAMLKFASGLDEEPRKFFEKFADMDYAAGQFAGEDKITYAYRSNNVGEKLWVDCTGYVTLRHDDGTPAMFTFGFSLIDSLGVYRQELQRKYVEQNAVLISQQEELELARDVAESANKSKTDFLFNMSHDIRTPMNAIMGFTNMAIKHIDDREKAIDCLEKTRKAGNMLLSLINSVLEMSRIESGHAALEKQQGDVYYSFANIENTLREMAESKDIRLSFEFGDIRDRFVFADFSRCMRIFVNVISNAIKYTPDGGFVKVRCEQVGQAKGGIAEYRYTVTDNGIGMSEEYQKHIFEQFSREQTSTVSGIQGSGLGMSVVKSFVDLMGGTIRVRSRQGEGSIFTITLPFRLQEKEEYTDPITGELVTSEETAAAETEENNFAGKRVLLVEDNEMNREIALELLEEAGLVVDDADDGTTAVEKLRVKGPGAYDFILMDIQMPTMNGYEATKAIRAMYPDSGLPIIALSANAFAEDRRKSVEAGMDDHVAKPIDIRELFGTLGRYL